MTREAQILEHLPQVRLIAGAFQRRLPRNAVPYDDLVSAGTIGLIHAVDNYDPAPGHALKTYAEWKIRGAIADSLRALDPQGRDDRRFGKRIAAAADDLEKRLERSPDETEIAGELGLDLAAYQRRRRQAVCLMMPLEYRHPDGQKIENTLPAPASPLDPAAAAELAERARWLGEQIRLLPARHRRILQLSYGRGLSLRAIGRRLGMHESRASQIRSEAVRSLRVAAGRDKLAA